MMRNALVASLALGAHANYKLKWIGAFAACVAHPHTRCRL